MAKSSCLTFEETPSARVEVNPTREESFLDSPRRAWRSGPETERPRSCDSRCSCWESSASNSASTFS